MIHMPHNRNVLLQFEAVFAEDWSRSWTWCTSAAVELQVLPNWACFMVLVTFCASTSAVSSFFTKGKIWFYHLHKRRKPSYSATAAVSDCTAGAPLYTVPMSDSNRHLCCTWCDSMMRLQQLRFAIADTLFLINMLRRRCVQQYKSGAPLAILTTLKAFDILHIWKSSPQHDLQHDVLCFPQEQLGSNINSTLDRPKQTAPPSIPPTSGQPLPLRLCICIVFQSNTVVCVQVYKQASAAVWLVTANWSCTPLAKLEMVQLCCLTTFLCCDLQITSESAFCRAP